MSNKIKIPDWDKYLEGRKGRLVTYMQGCRQYSMSYYAFVRLVKSAKAGTVIRKQVIVDLDILDDYLESCREVQDAKEEED